MTLTEGASYVVTGGAQGVGRAIAERLASDGHVVVLDPGASGLAWLEEHDRITAVVGDAGDEAAEAAARPAVPLVEEGASVVEVRGRPRPNLETTSHGEVVSSLVASAPHTSTTGVVQRAAISQITRTMTARTARACFQ
jgi:NAD(P)-dependent dehydrogenase (short-subunit alcohol dehydrogenase family)